MPCDFLDLASDTCAMTNIQSYDQTIVHEMRQLCPDGSLIAVDLKPFIQHLFNQQKTFVCIRRHDEDEEEGALGEKGIVYNVR